MSVFGWLGRSLSGAAARRQEASGDHIADVRDMVAPPAPGGVRLGERVLRVGSRGPDVGWVQQRLAVLPVDGVYGPLTAAAVATWQREHGRVLADGVVGPATWRALDVPTVAAPVFTPPLATGDFAERVTRMLRAASCWDAEAWAAVLAPRMEAAGLTAPNRATMFLANISHETGGLRVLLESLYYTPQRMTEVWPSRFPTVEEARPYARAPERLAERVYGGRMGNRLPGDGWRFRGRGCMQTTGRANYEALARVTGARLDALTADESPLLQREGAADSALLCWVQAGCNAAADSGQTERVRRIINGGTIGLDDVVALERGLRGVWWSPAPWP